MTGSRPRRPPGPARRPRWRVLRLRFVDQLTQHEIGREVGVSQMQVSRISRRALGKLLTAVRGEQAGSDQRRSLSGLVGRDQAP